MTLVKAVGGPASTAVGNEVRYQVTEFSPSRPPAADRAAVSWLVKSASGAALASVAGHGPELVLTVPAAWAGQTVMAMPFLRAPSTAVSITTVVAPATTPAPPGGAIPMAITREGRRYYAAAGGEPRFFLGLDVAYDGNRGLMNSANPPGPRYAAEDFEEAHGDWAWYLLPTITGESNRAFTCLNTYDRAAITLGHAQFAAHTPDDNLVVLLRGALAQPPAATYFPDLTVTSGRIHQRTGVGLTPLESATSTRGLMRYFNPVAESVDTEECDRSARLVHWCATHAAFRELMTEYFVTQQRRKLRVHATKLPLDGLTDKLCLVVLDILHQGRAKYGPIGTALGKADPFDALLSLGAESYRERVATLRQEIQKLEAAGRVGRKVYSRAAGDFVVPRGA